MSARSFDPAGERHLQAVDSTGERVGPIFTEGGVR
jgi:hypothetical protein